MAISTIYPNGINEVIVPATQSIAISNFGGGIASIYYLIVNANRPAAYQLQQTLNNSSVVLGAFADGMTIKIEAGPSIVRYDVGASPDTGIGDADTLNGLASDTAATADTIAARDSSGDIAANAFESTVTTGTAPLTVASTTVVPNLNADLLDGQEGSYYAVDSLAAHLAGAETFTGIKTCSANLIINNNTILQTKDSGGTAQSAIVMLTTDILRLGSINNNLEIITSGAIDASGSDLFIDNNRYYYAKETGDVTVRSILGIDTSNIVRIGNPNNISNIRSNGTLQYNGTTLASGTIDTTATQTITVVDGLITSIV